MPPLRERAEDIPLLVSYFVDRFAHQAGKTIRRVDGATLDLLGAYAWPGNVRELQNVIERAVIVSASDVLAVDPRWLPRARGTPPPRRLDALLAMHEREAIESALTASGGRVSGPRGAAVRLGLPASTLESKIRAHGIAKHRFRDV